MEIPIQPNIFFFFFWIINKVLLIPKRGHPSIQGIYNQSHKLHKSIKSATENKERLHLADSQSNRVLK